MKATYASRLEAGLIALGWTVDHTDRSKYKAFTKPTKSFKLFVGPNGALRKGECASRSWSIGMPCDAKKDCYYSIVLKQGDKSLETAKIPCFEGF